MRERGDEREVKREVESLRERRRDIKIRDTLR